MSVGAPARKLAQALAEESEFVAREVEGLGPEEADRALFFLLSAYDIATEMWFQKGDPTAPVLTNWELPWRKYGGDNPTTIYLSAPVSPNLRYRLRGPIGDAVYAGLQVYTKGPGFNATPPDSPKASSPSDTCCLSVVTFRRSKSSTSAEGRNPPVAQRCLCFEHLWTSIATTGRC